MEVLTPSLPDDRPRAPTLLQKNVVLPPRQELTVLWPRILEIVKKICDDVLDIDEKDWMDMDSTLFEISVSGVSRFPWRCMRLVCAAKFQKKLIEFHRHVSPFQPSNRYASISQVSEFTVLQFIAMERPPVAMQRLSEILVKGEVHYNKTSSWLFAVLRIIQSETLVYRDDADFTVPSLLENSLNETSFSFFSNWLSHTMNLPPSICTTHSDDISSSSTSSSSNDMSSASSPVNIPPEGVLPSHLSLSPPAGWEAPPPPPPQTPPLPGVLQTRSFEPILKSSNLDGVKEHFPLMPASPLSVLWMDYYNAYFHPPPPPLPTNTPNNTAPGPGWPPGVRKRREREVHFQQNWVDPQSNNNNNVSISGAPPPQRSPIYSHPSRSGSTVTSPQPNNNVVSSVLGRSIDFTPSNSGRGTSYSFSPPPPKRIAKASSWVDVTDEEDVDHLKTTPPASNVRMRGGRPSGNLLEDRTVHTVTSYRPNASTSLRSGSLLRHSPTTTTSNGPTLSRSAPPTYESYQKGNRRSTSSNHLNDLQRNFLQDLMEEEGGDWLLNTPMDAMIHVPDTTNDSESVTASFEAVQSYVKKFVLPNALGMDAAPHKQEE